jgi:hypothetical protein
VISDEDLKDMGRYNERTNIYDYDPELLYYRTDAEEKIDKLHFY